ncbi:MAG: class II fumarate hydratase [Thermodesulfobacteriota bacterium]|nr:class II fumarate hydratase [Thermodesulfobacteriota bacterium]
MMIGKDVAFRIERDTMGEVRVPQEAYYGAQTQRAVENFPVSGKRFPKVFVRALGLIKKNAALVNQELKLLDAKLARPIIEAAHEVATGKMDKEFVIDIFQTGSGTSTNMNANEVIATRANEMLTGHKDTRGPVHPNDHVNMGQSSNDVIPSAIHVAAVTSIGDSLVPALKILHEALEKKATAFDSIFKIGRTHLQDAVPIRLGQEFSGHARQIQLGMERVQWVTGHLAELALGGTAVGTGLNTPPGFASRVIKRISEETGYPFQEAENHFEAQGAQDAVVQASGALKTVAVSLMKIANDIRWLSCGPRCGIGEIEIPSLQPGSSIMPGKVNPVIPEAVTQVAAQVMGNDTAITMGCQAGNFELNVMLPVIAYNLLYSIKLLSASARIFAEKCVDGISANEARCGAFIEESLAMCTALAPVIGYEQAAAIAKEAYATGKTVREVAMGRKVLPEEELGKLLDPMNMT